jgi:hypothetical protein
MSDLAITSNQPTALALPSVPITIRPGVMDDVPFLDSLQKLHTKQVGWMPTKQFEGKIAAGHVLVAEAASDLQLEDGNASEPSGSHSIANCKSQIANRVGYLIGNDQYFKRDDVGIIYQMNVAPGKQRGLIGATLLKAQFERSAYGCKLYCCWCAQDIAANRFWEAVGFVPLAYRAGSEKKSRVHIFWQKRIRSDDTTTPWWFPSQTSGGSIREDRIVLPIPPGTHWSDAKPIILPGTGEESKQLPAKTHGRAATRLSSSKSRGTKKKVVEQRNAVARNGVFFDVPKQNEPVTAIAVVEKSSETPKRKTKNDPRLVAAARELRDRWLDVVNAGEADLPRPTGKYDVSRQLGATGPDVKRLVA